MVGLHFRHDEVAERLRRWIANPLCSARMGSNPILVADLLFTSTPSLLLAVCVLLGL